MKSCHRKNWLSLTTVIPSLVCDGERKEGERERERGREGRERGGRELLARTGMCSEYFDYWEMLLVLLVPAEHRWYERT